MLCLRSRRNRTAYFIHKHGKNVTAFHITVTSKICKIHLLCLRQWDSCLTVCVFYGQHRNLRRPTEQERINRYLALAKISGPHPKPFRPSLPSLLFFIFAKYNFADLIITYCEGNASVLDNFFSKSILFLCSLYTKNIFSPPCMEHILTFCMISILRI